MTAKHWVEVPFALAKSQASYATLNVTDTAQKTSFPIMDFFIKRNQNRTFLQIWSNLRKKSLTENLIFLTRKRMTCWHVHNYVWYFFHFAFCFFLSLSDATKSMFLLFVNLLLHGFSLQLNSYSSLFSRLHLLLNSLTKVSSFINTA